MRTIDRTTQFNRDYKRENRSGQHSGLGELLQAILKPLILDKPLAEKHRDHELVGDWVRHRECHIKPDLLLIYSKPDDHTLLLIRLGSHNELFN